MPVASSTAQVIHGNQPRILGSLDLSLELDKKDYNEKLNFYQGKLNKLARHAHQKEISSVLVFEGWDAGGKGGQSGVSPMHLMPETIRLSPSQLQPQYYLWRFWRHMPRTGRITIYDRSWYGRVLVERVEGFASEQEWTRAYSEISNFEEALTDHGIVLLKFWLYIDPDEQLRRFKEREQISYKQHKITEEDYRNRDKWAEYSLAVNDMAAHTSSQTTPWTLVEANNKRYARIKVIKTYCDALEKHWIKYA
ncbi:Polyphosphate:AMP phosphotransferase [methanotrophic bacterial endosymbiont of Bathymodiolus sp.]|nr:Polyphosphate:AMP phosphotransferase [methanotrophic bacterial endosymbiont of Bathymodiolus sp.]